MRNPKKTRMCVVCRVRMAQGEMSRFALENLAFSEFKGVGRSAYVCRACDNENNFAKLKKRYKIQNQYKTLKECLEYGKN